MKYIAYVRVEKIEGEKRMIYFVPIGVGSTQANGEIAVTLDAVPVNGQVVLRVDLRA